MREEIIDRLYRLNQEFYQTFADAFSETRSRVQPGVLRAIKKLAKDSSVLDLGCGNGSLANQIAALGHQGHYIGVDSTPQLIRIAREECTHTQARFYLRDLSHPSWSQGLPAPFDRIYAFAVLHHIPGEVTRQQILKTLHPLLKPEGQFIFSVWNFLASPRLKDRILPWEILGLKEDELDLGDYLLDWRHGGYGLRYVHYFDQSELSQLAQHCGFRVRESYYMDGAEGNLGRYNIWQANHSHAL